MHLFRPMVAAPRARSFMFSFTLWLFGFSTTVLLIGMWGRSVATDEVTLAASARAVLESQIVNERVLDWVGEGIASAGDIAPAATQGAVARIGQSPELRQVLADIVDQTVQAALAEPGTGTELDLSSSIDALTPVVVRTLSDEGIAVNAAEVRSVLGDLPRFVLTDESRQFIGQSAYGTARFLTWVVVVGLAGVMSSGGLVIRLAADRVRQVRDLATRLGVSAITFALILRVGAWAVNPEQGRSPVADGGAVLMSSNGHVLWYVGAAAAVLVAASTAAIVRMRRPRSAAPGDAGGGGVAEQRAGCEPASA